MMIKLLDVVVHGDAGICKVEVEDVWVTQGFGFEHSKGPDAPEKVV